MNFNELIVLYALLIKHTFNCVLTQIAVKNTEMLVCTNRCLMVSRDVQNA